MVSVPRQPLVEEEIKGEGAKTQLVKKLKRITAMVLMMVMLVPYMAYGQESAARSTFTDITGHWAEETIIKWSNMGLVNGQSADRFNPNASITRAELAALINKVADVSGEASISFTDVASSKWYYIEVAKAVSAGYMQGYADGTFKPEAPITRQELAVLITRLLGITEQEPDAAYTDVANAPAWSKGAIGAMINSGIMSGKSAGQFSPLTSTTRAEAVVILDRIASRVVTPEVPALTVTYDEAGTYGGEAQETVEGAVIISAADVILQNTTIAGDLTITADVGEGDVTLRGVTVRGRTLIQGGGENSIHFEGSSLGQVEVNKAGGKVRVTFDETSEAELVRLQSPTKVEAAEGSEVGEVELGEQLPAGAEIVLDGSFGRVVVGSQQSNITADNGTIGTFQVKKEAKGSKVQLGKNSKVTQLTLDSGTSVTGEGSVDKATINAEGSTLSKKPGNVVVADGVQASVGGSTVGGTTTTPPAVGGGGGFVPNPGNPGGGGAGPNPNPGTPGETLYTVTGMIQDNEGSPLEGYELSIFNVDTEQFYHAETSNGRFEVSLPTGNYSITGVYLVKDDVELLDYKWIDQTFVITTNGNKTLSFTAHDANLFIDMIFPEDLAEQEYYLLYINHLSDPDVSYFIYTEKTQIARYAKNGEYSVDYYSPALGDIFNIGTFTVNGQAEVSIRFPSSVQGQVQLDGEPLSSGRFVYNDQREVERTIPIVNGKFEARLGDGDYTQVRVVFTNTSNTEVVMPLDDFSVTAGVPSQALSYNLNGPRLIGTLVNELGEPIDGALILASEVHHERVDVVNGNFIVYNLPNGDYRSILYSDAKGNSYPIDGAINIYGDGTINASLTKKINKHGTIEMNGSILNDAVLIIQRYIPPSNSPGAVSPAPVGGVAQVYVENGSFSFYLPFGEYVIYEYKKDDEMFELNSPVKFSHNSFSPSQLDIEINEPNFEGMLYETDGVTPIRLGQLLAQNVNTSVTYISRVVNGKYVSYLPNGSYEITLNLLDRPSLIKETILVEQGKLLNNPFDNWTLPPTIQLTLSLTGYWESGDFFVIMSPGNFSASEYYVRNGKLDIHMKPGSYTIIGYREFTSFQRLQTNITFEVPDTTAIRIPRVLE
ncbi:S-layer homology domain-containing protein [Paenibacillus daejeonensis]|uniref:S-layer homology domain-containing protein n=1 Tax=Paenibacillus daejeonensis TaxID=135193 RepID=UPI00035F47AF|nr:S-layer homology domain-containing protein [Paenibacillus daejeonensis]